MLASESILSTVTTCQPVPLLKMNLFKGNFQGFC